MIPFGDHEVTLLNRSESGGYTAKSLTGCSWSGTRSRSVDGDVLDQKMVTVCRIPTEQICPATGDLLILGKVQAAADNEIDLVRLMQSVRAAGKEAFRVQNVKKNTQIAQIAHWRAEGE